MTQQEENNVKKNNEDSQQQQSYAVRPQHHYRRLEYSEQRNLGIRNKLNIAFILLAIVGMALWYMLDDHTPAAIVLLLGVVLKIVEVCIRLFRK